MRVQFIDTVTRRIPSSGLLEPLGNIRVSVFERGTTNPVTIYAGRTGATTKTNPFTTDVDGIVVLYADPGPYDVVYHDLNATPRIADTTVEWNALSAETGGIPEWVVAMVRPPGEIIFLAGATLPTGFLLCNGAAISRNDFGSLFNEIGVLYGAGNGSTTFNIPDLRGRTLVGAGSGSGLTTRALAAAFGAETHQLTEAQIPAHDHEVTDPEHVHNFGGASLPIIGPGSNVAYDGTSGRGAVTQTAGASTGITIQDAGGGQAHNNMQPSLAVNVAIKT